MIWQSFHPTLVVGFGFTYNDFMTITLATASISLKTKFNIRFSKFN